MRKNFIIAFLMLIHLGITVYVSAGILGGIAHISDSAIYYRQAILLSQGKLFLSNFTMQPRDAFMLMGTYERDEKIFFTYPHFWPVLIGIFIKLHMPWLLSPLLSTLSLFLIFLIARKLFDENTGIIASLLYCFSPFAILMAGDYLTHTVTSFFLLAVFYLLLVYVDKPKIWPCLLAGLLLGYAFDVRQVTTIGVFAPIGIFLLIFYRKRILNWKSAWFVLGFSVFIVLLLAENYVMSGSVLKSSYPVGIYKEDPELLFSPTNFHIGANHADAAFSFLSPILFHSFIPLVIPALSVVPLLVLRRKQDFLMMGIFMSLFFSYTFTYVMGLHGYGPRYYFEALFALFILAAQGIMWIVKQLSGKRKLVVIAVLLLLLICNLIGLIKILPLYMNYNYIPTDMFEKIKALDLKNSIIIIGRTVNWFEDGITATLYDPEYKNSFFIKELENGDHLKVLQQYPEKKLYKIKTVNELELLNFTNSTNLNTTVSKTV